MQKIGIALGAGGARGLAHIIIFEALEELKIKPSFIAGSSIGAIIGAFYAAGLSSTEIKLILNEIIYGKKSKFWEIHKKSDFSKYFDLLDPTIKSGGLLKGDKLINFLADKLKVSKFSELKIPLKVITTDYNKKCQIVIDDGDLLSAIRASYALPFLFSPVKRDKKLLIDGGMVNPLPFDVLQKKCDIVVAIDVSAANGATPTLVTPPSYEILFSAFQIMQSSIINAKMKTSKPDIHIKTNIKDVRVHEFMKAEKIFKSAEPYKEELKNQLKQLLEL